jgi:hypothetical protein
MLLEELTRLALSEISVRFVIREFTQRNMDNENTCMNFEKRVNSGRYTETEKVFRTRLNRMTGLYVDRPDLLYLWNEQVIY